MLCAYVHNSLTQLKHCSKKLWPSSFLDALLFQGFFLLSVTSILIL